MRIRNYREKDYPMLIRWWQLSGERPPEEDMLPEESTFIVEDADGVPLVSVSLYLLNVKACAWVENFVGNPVIPKETRQKATLALRDHILLFAKALGYRRLLCMGLNQRIGRYYKKLGFHKTAEVSTYVLEVG